MNICSTAASGSEIFCLFFVVFCLLFVFSCCLFCVLLFAFICFVVCFGVGRRGGKTISLPEALLLVHYTAFSKVTTEGPFNKIKLRKNEETRRRGRPRVDSPYERPAKNKTRLFETETAHFKQKQLVGPKMQNLMFQIDFKVGSCWSIVKMGLDFRNHCSTKCWFS